MKLKDVKTLNFIISRIDAQNTKYAQLQGVNSYELKVLLSLSDEHFMRQKDICDKCGMPKQTVNNVIRKLTEKGYIRLNTKAEDKREKTISLTLEGQKYLKDNLEPLMKQQESIALKMGEDKYRTLIESLESYAKAMEESL